MMMTDLPTLAASQRATHDATPVTVHVLCADGIVGPLRMSLGTSPGPGGGRLLSPWPAELRGVRAVMISLVDGAADDDEVVVVARSQLPAVCAAMRRRPERRPPPASLSPADQAQRDRLVELLARHRGNTAAVARELATPRTTVQRMMARLGIDRRAAAYGAGTLVQNGSTANPDSGVILPVPP